MLIITSFLILFVDIAAAVGDPTLDFLINSEKKYCAQIKICNAVGDGNQETVPTENVSLSLPVEPPEFTHPSCCSGCSCNKSSCFIEGTCCLDALDHLPSTEDSFTMVRMTCEYPQLRPHAPFKVANAGNAVNMIRRCPTHVVKLDVVDKCEDPDSYDDIYTKIPVTDRHTLYSYHNKFCANCNSVPIERQVYWKPTVNCITGTYEPEKIGSVVKDIGTTKDCNLIYELPTIDGVELPKCTKVISTCNETGLWKTYDSVIENTCLAYMTIYNKRFKNVFCYMCNTNEKIAPGMCYAPPTPFDTVSFSALLKLPEQERTYDVKEIPERECEDAQIYDPAMGRCRDVRCKFPKTLDNQTCENMADKLGGVAYDVYIELVPIMTEHYDTGLLMPFLLYDDLINGIMNATDSSATNLLVSSLNVKPTENRSPFEVDYTLVYLNLQMGVTMLTDVSVLDYILNLDHASLVVDIDPTWAVNFTMKLSHWHEGTHNVIDMRTNTSLMNLAYDTNEHYSNPYTTKPTASERLTKFYKCPFVVLDGVNISYNNTSTKYSVMQYGQTISIENILMKVNQRANKSTTSVYICLDTFKSIISNFDGNQKGHKEQNVDHVIIILSFVCILISVVSSICTLIVYSVFKILRTQPGINNMILAIHLIIAQSLFQFGFAQADRVSLLACKLIGIGVHYSWMLLVTWMHICSVHMFKVFNRNKQNTIEINKIKVTFRYLICCWLVAMLPMLSNIVITSLQSNGSDIGYGGSYCYITKAEMVVYLFTVPILVITVINIILYIIVIVQIKRSASIGDRHQEKRNFVLIYAKLSTLTGGTWVFGFIFLITDMKWAEYLFVLLNASQGFFIFVAFVVNKRVYQLIKSSAFKTLTTSTQSSHATEHTAIKHSV